MQPEYTDRLMHPKMSYYRDVYKDSTRWDGEEELKDKTVIVYGEQGYGDIIQFMRYIPLLAEHGCKIFLHIPSCLHSLMLENLEVECQCIDKDSAVLPVHDFHIPSLSLPFVLGTHEADVPYIKMKEDEIGIVDDGYFKIGIAWEGNPGHSNNSERSCPLAVFRKIHNMERTKLFMIQPKIQNEVLIQGCEDLDIFGTELTDFKSTAKLINSMNIVVSVDTSVMHLASAMGKKTYCLLSYNHDPRWDLGIQWYPTMKPLTQKFAGDWAGITSELSMHVSMELQKWLIKNPVKP